MKRSSLLFVFLALLASAPVAHAADTDGAQARARAYLKHGLHILSVSADQPEPSRRLALADRALASLHRAHAIQRVQPGGDFGVLSPTIEGAIVRALNVKARVYLGRGSLVQAQRTNRAALSYSVSNIEALKLRAEIHRALITDIYELVQGRHAIERIRARHEDGGAPLRDREVARRR